VNDLGVFYFYIKKYPQAIEQFKRTVELDKKNAGAYASLGTSYFLTNQYDAAVEAFNKELALDPQNGHNIHYIATAYQKLGKMDLALKYEAMAKQFNPDFKLK
jgi:tetratricopeptide (TPR) repeat protein